jgi:MFS family permease
MGIFTSGSMKYFTVAVMTAINLLNYVDRYTIAGILKELDKPCTSGFKKPLDDTENGLLQTAFIVSYMLCSPVFGYLGDRFTRKYIITGGILAWAGCTLLGSFSVVSSSHTHTHTSVHCGPLGRATRCWCPLGH